MTDQRSPYDEKLASILSAAGGVIAEKGYHNASIRDIARATGVSLSGLYYYFQSKEELLYLIQDHAFGTLLCRLEERLAGVEDPQLRLRILIENHLTYFVDNMAEMKVLSHEAESLNGEYLNHVNQKKKRLTEIAVGILRELLPGSDLDERTATFALFGMMNWLYNWYRPHRGAPVERLVQDLTRLFIGGFLHPAELAPSHLVGSDREAAVAGKLSVPGIVGTEDAAGTRGLEGGGGDANPAERRSKPAGARGLAANRRPAPSAKSR